MAWAWHVSASHSHNKGPDAVPSGGLTGPRDMVAGCTKHTGHFNSSYWVCRAGRVTGHLMWLRVNTALVSLSALNDLWLWAPLSPWSLDPVPLQRPGPPRQGPRTSRSGHIPDLPSGGHSNEGQEHICVPLQGREGWAWGAGRLDLRFSRQQALSLESSLATSLGRKGRKRGYRPPSTCPPHLAFLLHSCSPAP